MADSWIFVIRSLEVMVLGILNNLVGSIASYHIRDSEEGIITRKFG